MRPKVEFTKSGKTVEHGSSSSYNNHKCRCPECTEAWRVYLAARGYVKNYRERKKRPQKKGVNITL